MTNLTLIPIEDNFETILSSELGSAATDLTFTTRDFPTATIPSGFKIPVTINPGKSNEECVLISTLTTATNTWTIASDADRSQALGNGISSTNQTHPNGSVVVISNPFILWDNLKDMADSKVDVAGDTMTGKLQWSGTTHAGLQLISLTTAQRTALTGANGDLVYDSDIGEIYQYIAGAWSAVSSGSTQPNASTTVAGKIELATDAEVDAGTDVGGTSAQLVADPSQIAEVIQEQKHTYIATDTGTATTIVGSVTPTISAYVDGMKFVVKVANAITGALTANFNSVGAKSVKKQNDQAIASGDIEANQRVELIYRADTDDFEMMSPVASDPGVDTFTLTALEAITANDAVALIPNEVEFFSQLTDNNLAFGDNNARARYAIKIIPTVSGTMTDFKFRAAEAVAGATALGNLNISFETDNSGEPSGTAVAGGTETISQATQRTWNTTMGTRTATWDSPISFTAGTTYWLVFDTDSIDPTNFLNLGENSSYDENYNTFTRLTYDLGAATWGSSVTNATPFFWGNTETKPFGMGLVPTDANWGGRTWTFVGFAKSAAAIGASTSVFLDKVSDLSGLTPGSDYWLSTTAGAITTTKPTALYDGNSAAYKIGRAESTTDLKIELGEKLYFGELSPTGSATTAHTITPWFKLKSMELHGSYLSTAVIIHVTDFGIYDGVNNYVRGHVIENGANPVSGFSGGTFHSTNSFGNDYGGSTGRWGGVGASLSDIGFTYTVTKTGSASDYEILFTMKG